MALPEGIELTEITVDLEELTLDDLDVIEEMTGAPFTELGKNMTAKTLRAMAFVSLRRKHPEVTAEDVGRLKVKVAKTDPPEPAAA